jgi:cellulose synthase/poly-beta-1,6-N-acetylglucosamine synthase-like glycosyltransferase
MLRAALTVEPVLRIGLLVLLCCLAAVVVASLAYSLTLLIIAAFESRRRRKAANASQSSPQTRFLVVIPAHDEELVLPATLDALSRLDYPVELRRIVVIADNCSDGTADLARSHNGLQVLERTDHDLKSKGHALNWALTKLLSGRDFDLVVIIDADTQMDPAFLQAMDQAYEKHGASELYAAQGLYDVLNADQGWRAALMAGALKLVHFVRPLARERLGLSAGLKGNGMCLSAPLLSKFPWRGDSLTEDIEYALDLAQNCGLAVRFVPEAVVCAQMPTTAGAARSQRQRWEQGRYGLLRSRGLGLLWRGIAKRNRVAFDSALDLFIPPLAELVSCWACWGIGILAAYLVGWLSPELRAFVWAWAASALALLAYVVGGFVVGQAPRAAYKALLFAPFYVMWKMLLYLFRRRDEGWVRTERMEAANE